LVRVYRPTGGGWTVGSYQDVVKPSLRRDRLTRLDYVDGRPWVVELTPAGEEMLFPLPESAIRSSGDWEWSGRGDYAILRDTRIVVRRLAPDE
jgi:hypothetical protein